MKKNILTAIVFSIVTLCCMSQTSDKVYVDDFNIVSKGSKRINVCLDNPNNAFCAFQFDLHLPDGVCILGADGLIYYWDTWRTEANHDMSVVQLEKGIYRFICYSLSNSVFSGQEGPIADFFILTDGSLTDGTTLTGSIENIILTKTDGNDVKPGKTTFNITIGPAAGIDDLKAEEGDLVVYDIRGNRIYDVENLKKGVYIVNGRKIFIDDKNPQKP